MAAAMSRCSRSIASRQGPRVVGDRHVVAHDEAGREQRELEHAVAGERPDRHVERGVRLHVLLEWFVPGR